jgi:hypothetical protein
MATLTPQLSTNGSMYNFGIAETYSYVDVLNDQNRPLFAKAVYSVNIPGQNGFAYVDSTNGQINGSFTSILVVSSCKFAGLTATNSTTSGLTSQTLPQGFSFNGPITNFSLVYGSVLAYK